MITREQRNKKLNNEINYEKTIKISKKILKIIFIFIFFFSILFLYAYFVGTKGIRTHEYIIKDDIPRSFNAVKILHFSDILYGKTINNNDLNFLLEEFKLINPDLVFFTGNLINGEYKLEENEIKNINSFMKKIPYKLGKYAVKGNLDTNNFDLIMENTDFNILDNNVVNIYNNSQEELSICGININKKENININNNYTITIINNYDKYKDYNIKSSLVFAGNNLGGEIRFFNKPILGNNQYINNYYEENGSKIYISNGLGSIHHLRFMNHPSINVYRLYSKNS